MNPNELYLAITCKTRNMGMFIRCGSAWFPSPGRGLRRSRFLTLSKFRDPQLEPLAVLNPRAPAPASPRAQVWKLLHRSQFRLCCPSLAWVLVRSPRRAGRHKTMFFPLASGTTSRMHKSLVQLKLSHYFVWALNPFHLWWANFATVRNIFIQSYVFGKGIRFRIWKKKNRLGNYFLYFLSS